MIPLSLALLLNATACRQGGQDHAEANRAKTSDDFPLACDLAELPNRNTRLPLISGGFIEQLIGIQPIDMVINPPRGTGESQYDEKDRDRLREFYHRYDVIARPAEQATKRREVSALVQAFEQSMDLIRAWGESGIKQKSCNSCNGAIRQAIAKLPVIIALNIFNVDGNRDEFKQRIARYLSTSDDFPNIGPPAHSAEPREESLSGEVAALAESNVTDDRDLHYSLMIYFMMNANTKRADREWKKMSAGQLVIHGNALVPMADDQQSLFRDLRNPSNSPFDIVKKQRINADEHRGCSSLYRNFIEYLVLSRDYDPRYANDSAPIRRQLAQFEAIADPRLISLPMRMMMNELAGLE